jgi:hypothetical protein
MRNDRLGSNSDIGGSTAHVCITTNSRPSPAGVDSAEKCQKLTSATLCRSRKPRCFVAVGRSLSWHICVRTRQLPQSIDERCPRQMLALKLGRHLPAWFDPFHVRQLVREALVAVDAGRLT